MKIQKNLMNR